MFGYVVGGVVSIYTMLSVLLGIFSENGGTKLNALLFVVVFIAVFIGVFLWCSIARLITGKWPKITDVNDDIVFLTKEINKINKRLTKMEGQNGQTGKTEKGRDTQKPKRTS